MLLITNISIPLLCYIIRYFKKYSWQRMHLRRRPCQSHHRRLGARRMHLCRVLYKAGEVRGTATAVPRDWPYLMWCSAGVGGNTLLVQWYCGHYWGSGVRGLSDRLLPESTTQAYEPSHGQQNNHRLGATKAMYNRSPHGAACWSACWSTLAIVQTQSRWVAVDNPMATTSRTYSWASSIRKVKLVISR